MSRKNAHGRNVRTPSHVGHTAPRLLNRQKALLAFLDAHGGCLMDRDLENLLFLYSKEANASAPFEFVPHRYGAHSFLSYADRRKLVRAGLIADRDSDWLLTPEGKNIARTAASPLMVTFADRLRNLRGDPLVAETYRRFPFYAIHSTIKSRVLGDDQSALQRIEDAVPCTMASPLVTIGYEGRTIDRFLTILLKAGVTVLCDVRRNPVSRKYGFSKKTLKTVCAAVRVRYEHLPELGVRSELRRSLGSQAQYDQLFRTYESETLPNEQGAISTIRTWIRAAHCVALVCLERYPNQCHRHVVAKEVRRSSARHLHVVHL